MARRTCGYCGGTGHNRSTCPVEKGNVEDIRAKYPDNWQVREYDQRHARRKETRLRASQDRKCSYCGEQGHNRRSCTTLKQHKHYATSPMPRLVWGFWNTFARRVLDQAP